MQVHGRNLSIILHALDFKKQLRVDYKIMFFSSSCDIYM
jgi:hypothetical protein